jgi:hypothetical protein
VLGGGFGSCFVNFRIGVCNTLWFAGNSDQTQNQVPSSTSRVNPATHPTWLKWGLLQGWVLVDPSGNTPDPAKGPLSLLYRRREPSPAAPLPPKMQKRPPPGPHKPQPTPPFPSGNPPASEAGWPLNTRTSPPKDKDKTSPTPHLRYCENRMTRAMTVNPRCGQPATPGKPADVRARL